MADQRVDLRAEMPGAKFSGGPIEGFTGGWAKLCFSPEKPHYWRDITDRVRDLVPEMAADMRAYEALCGATGYSALKAPAFGVGNYPVCKRCMKKAATWPNKEQRTTIYESDPRVRELFRRG